MLDWLKQIWEGPVVATAEHPLFGPMQLTRIRGEETWEAESVPVGDRTVAVYFRTSGSQLPSKAQIRFLQDTTRDVEAAFQKAATVLASAYEEIHGPLTTSLRETFQLSGIEVPLDGNPTRPWMLQFETVSGRYALFTVYFQDGVAVDVQHDS
ncbi:hypothetical protein [Stenotrophomonas sp.]|uniref:hypothetical protein n=1 Tax=Stenotrophomonas sp. TaxID=69392 RepID=UPI0028AD0400|nr:hypothetical protein [Stenotrophomonas sp.]